MIRVKKNSNTISISGHANYSEFGKDIVCSSVSSIVATVVNCIMNIDNDSIVYEDDGNVITIFKKKDNNVVDIILDTMIELMKDLEKQYKENIKVESEE